MGNQPTTLIDNNKQPVNSYNKRSTLDLFAKRLSLNKLNKFSKKSKKKGTYYPVPPNAERPSAPSCPEVFQDQDQYFILRWEAPAVDGGVPIMGYIIQHLELGLPQLDSQDQDDTDSWYSSEPGQITQTECILNNLVPGTTYQFRVIAENLIGYSQPSDISEPIVFNPHGELDDWFFSPSFTMRLDESYTVMEHEMLTLSVELKGQPYPIVRWYDKNEQDLSKINSKKYRTRSSGFTRMLIINSVELSDAGFIKCIGINKEGMVECMTALNVEAPPRIKRVQSPEFLQNPYDVNEKEEERLTAIEDDYEDLIFQAGELVRLKFLYSGSPKPSVQIIHNGEPVTDPRIITEFTEKVITVKIENILRCDRGEWLIKLENVLGEDCTSVLITVTDHPSPPGKPEILQLSDNTCILRWDDPSDDGGCPISIYIVEYFRTEWGVWLKALTSKTPNAKIKDLIPGSKYRFRLKAENLYGVSEPSEESVEILITDLPSTRNTITGETGGLMTTLEESIEEDEDVKDVEKGEKSSKMFNKKLSPRRGSPLTESTNRESNNNKTPPSIKIETPSEVKLVPEEGKKLYSRSDLIRSAVTSSVNYVQRFLDETIGPLENEKEAIKMESPTYDDEEEYDDYDFEKLQREYEEEMNRLRKDSLDEEEDSEDYDDEDFEKIELDTKEGFDSVDEEAELEKQKLDEEMKERFEKMKKEWEEEDQKIRQLQLQEQTLKNINEEKEKQKKDEKSVNVEVDRIKREIAEREVIQEREREAANKREAAQHEEKFQHEAHQYEAESQRGTDQHEVELHRSAEILENRIKEETASEEDDWRAIYSARRRGMRSEEKTLQPTKKVLLHDRFTDYLTMKVNLKDKKIGSSLRSLNSSNESSNKSNNQSRENLRRMLDFDEEEQKQPIWQSNPDVNKIKPILNEFKIRDRKSPLSASLKKDFKPHDVVPTTNNIFMANDADDDTNNEQKEEKDYNDSCYVKHATYHDDVEAEEEKKSLSEKVFTTSTTSDQPPPQPKSSSSELPESETPPAASGVKSEKVEIIEKKATNFNKNYLILFPLFYIDIYLTLIAIVVLVLWNKYKSS